MIIFNNAIVKCGCGWYYGDNDIDAGDGSDSIDIGKGSSVVDLGKDNDRDWLYIDGAAGDVTIVKNATKNDIIYVSWAKLRTVEGRDVIYHGSNGSKVILKDYIPEEENPDGDGNNGTPLGDGDLPIVADHRGWPYKEIPGKGLFPMCPVGEVPTLFRCVAANDFDCGVGGQEIKLAV